MTRIANTILSPSIPNPQYKKYLNGRLNLTLITPNRPDRCVSWNYNLHAVRNFKPCIAINYRLFVSLFRLKFIFNLSGIRIQYPLPAFFTMSITFVKECSRVPLYIAVTGYHLTCFRFGGEEAYMQQGLE